MLKTILFGFMTNGHISLRELEDSCKVNLRFIYLMDHETHLIEHSATFMRIKTDYIGNGQLLPAYNVKVSIADEYIAVVDMNQYRSDMDCFVPLLDKFKEIYGFYPKYPVADAGYGSYNNYIFCKQNGMEKYMKFPMFKKETMDKKYQESPFRAVNFPIGEDGKMRCLNGKAFHLKYRQNVEENAYGRQEEEASNSCISHSIIKLKGVRGIIRIFRKKHVLMYKKRAAALFSVRQPLKLFLYQRLISIFPIQFRKNFFQIRKFIDVMNQRMFQTFLRKYHALR